MKKNCKKIFLTAGENFLPTFISVGLVFMVGVVNSGRWRFFRISWKVGGARSKFKSGQVVKLLTNCKVSQY